MSTSRSVNAIAPDLWIVDEPQPVGPGVVFPNRMVVVRLSGGGLWLHSPLAPDDALAAALAELGPVRALVEPNLFHHLHIAPASERWPQAEVLGLAGHAKKQPAVSFGSLDEAADRWKPELEMAVIRGVPAMDERVFFHRPSASLIVTDLVFHIHETEGGFTPWLLRLVGAHRRLAQSRSVRFMTKDRVAAAESARQILSWPFERVVMSHGELVETHARSRLEAALERMLVG